MRLSSLRAGVISPQSAPIFSQTLASVFVAVTDAVRKILMAILASSALS